MAADTTNRAQTSISDRYCFGRLVMDVPASFNLTAAVPAIFGSQFSVLRTGSKADFDRLVDQRRAQLRAMSAPAGLNSALFADIPHPRGHVFGFTSDPIAYQVGGGSLEVYAHNDNTIFVSQRTAVQSQGQLRFLEQDMYMIERIAPRARGEVPSEPAFCFEGGMIRTPRVESEVVTFTFIDRAVPNTNFQGTVDTSTLVSGYQSPFSTRPSSVKVNNRQFVGLNGQEAYSFLPQTAGESGFYFLGRAPVRNIGSGSPKIRLEYKQWQQPAGASHDEAARKSTWDAILGAMRFSSGTL